MESKFEKKKVEWFVLWVLPALFLFTGALYWFLQNKLTYFAYLSFFPFIFAAVFVNITASLFRLWRWNNEILPQICIIHRPLVYAAYFNLPFLLTARLLLLPTTRSTLVESILVVSVVGMLMGFVHDLFGVEVGLYEIRGSMFNRNKHGALLVVSRYGFAFFGMISAVFGAAAKLGHYYLYESSSNLLNWFPLGMLFGLASTIPFFIWSISRFIAMRR